MAIQTVILGFSFYDLWNLYRDYRLFIEILIT